MIKIGQGLKRIFLVLIICLPASSFAQYGSLDQYRMELGLLGGAAFYIGDANPTKLFNRSQPAYGALVRFNLNPRWTIKGAVTRAKVAGDTRDFPNKFPANAQADFERKFWDVGANIEFNFLNYGLPPYANQSSWFSPYIFVGVGVAAYHDDLSDINKIDFNLPFGLGVKFKIKNRFNAGLEWSMHTLFVDDFDVVDNNSIMLDNPYEFSGMSKIKNNDRYSVAKVFLSVDLFKRKHCK